MNQKEKDYSLMKYRSGGKPDKGQDKIVKALRKIGAIVIITSQVRNSFDLLVCHAGKTYIVEVKDGTKPPSQRQLREGELKCNQDLESVGVKYWIINSVEEALEMIK